jgi:fatty acid hydroxylase domain-containing protein 2
MLVAHGVYWLWGSFFMLLDYTGWLSQYKVQPNTNQPPNPVKLAATIQQVLSNQFLISVPYSAFAFCLINFTGSSAIDLDRYLQVPTFEWLLLEVVFHEFAYEVSFYITHRYF